MFLLGDFNINLLHNDKCILTENQAMQNCIPTTSLMSQYKLFFKDIPLSR